MIRAFKQRIAVRVDASSQMGIGHFVRCLVLAQECKKRGVVVTFITSCEDMAMYENLLKYGFGVHKIEKKHPHHTDLEMTLDVLKKHSVEWLILDGYHFDYSYQRRITEAGFRLLLFDDLAEQKRYDVNTILNQNIYAKDLKYVCSPNTKLLLGCEYVQLRSEFLKWKKFKRNTPKVAKKILVNLGGGDYSRQSNKIVEALKGVDIKNLEIIAIASANSDNFYNMQAEASHARVPMKCIYNSGNIPHLMAWADLAISVGGSISWEMAFMGLPSLLFIFAENQERAVGVLNDRGIALGLGWLKATEADVLTQEINCLAYDGVRRRDMSLKGQKEVDGLGGKRVADFLCQ